MKRIIALVIICLSLLAVVACGSHRHMREKDYTYDNTHHWYRCQDKDCQEKLEYKPHNWSEGTQTVKPTAEKEGIMSYFCRTCFATKEEKVPYIPKSTVTSTQWERAFSKNSLENLTAQLVDAKWVDGVEHRLSFDVQGDGTTIYVTFVKSVDGYEVDYQGKYQVGNNLWTMSKGQALEDANMSQVIGNDVMKTSNILSDYNLELIEYFDSFSYDSQTKSYIANDIEAYSEIEVTFSDGKISKITATSTEKDSNITITLSKYGETVPTPPTKNQDK